MGNRSSPTDTMRHRLLLLSCLVMGLFGCGGGGDAGLTKPRLLDIGDRWDFARTTTTITNGQTTTDQRDVTWRIASAPFQGQTRMSLTFTPTDMAADRLAIRQDTFSRQVDIIGSVKGVTETAQSSVYIPASLAQGYTFPTLIVTPTQIVAANATVGREESVTVRNGTYRAYKITATAGGVTLTQWLRPGLGVPIKQVIVENDAILVRTTDWQLIGTNVSE